MPSPLRHLLLHSSLGTTSLALLILRIGAGGMMAFGHGLVKLKQGNTGQFPDPLGIGNSMSYFGAVGAEFFACILIAVGLFTRLACLPIIFAMLVAAVVVHGKDPLFMGGPGAAKEPAVIYLIMFTTILVAGPGVFSFDHALFGKKRHAAPAYSA